MMMNMCDFSDLPITYDYDSNNMTNDAISQNNREEKQVYDAAKLSYQTGSIIPLLKQELRYSIQIRRVCEGKGELHVEFKQQKPSELTDNEKEKKKRRKEQNRMAAMRFRQKNRNKGSVLLKDVERLQTDNALLKNIQSQLLREKETLIDKLKGHVLVCNLSPLQSDLDILFSRQ